LNIVFKTIKTPNSFYLYDRNKNHIVRLNETEYVELLDVEKSAKNIEDFTSLKKFQDAGFLLESQLETIKNPVTSHTPHIVNHHRDQLVLQVTQRCNLRCGYCIYSEKGEYHNRTHSDKDMSIEMAEKSIDEYFKASEESKERVIAFYGGEPLLKFDLVKHCVQYAKKRSADKEVKFVMTCNGTLLTLEIAKFLADVDFDLLISLDGSREEHNEYRKFANGKGSFDTIMSNLTVIKKELPEYYKKISFNTVLNPKHKYENIKDYFQNDEIVADAAVMHTLVAENDDGSNMNFTKEFKRSRSYDYSMLLLHMLERLDISYVSKFHQTYKAVLIKKHEQLTSGGGIGSVNHHSGPCVPGGRRVFVNVHGDLYPCERVSESCVDEKIGNLDEGIDLKKVDKLLNIGTLSENECKKCWAFMHCDMCCKAAENGAELCRNAKLKHCKNSKSTAYSDLQEICLLRELGCIFD